MVKYDTLRPYAYGFYLLTFISSWVLLLIFSFFAIANPALIETDAVSTQTRMASLQHPLSMNYFAVEVGNFAILVGIVIVFLHDCYVLIMAEKERDTPTITDIARGSLTNSFFWIAALVFHLIHVCYYSTGSMVISQFASFGTWAALSILYLVHYRMLFLSGVDSDEAQADLKTGRDRRGKQKEKYSGQETVVAETIPLKSKSLLNLNAKKFIPNFREYFMTGRMFISAYMTWSFVTLVRTTFDTFVSLGAVSASLREEATAFVVVAIIGTLLLSMYVRDFISPLIWLYVFSAILAHSSAHINVILIVGVIGSGISTVVSILFFMLA